MSEQNPTLEQLNENPTLAGKTDDEKVDLVSIEGVSSVIQEGHENNPEASDTLNKERAEIMDKLVKEPLRKGVDEYAILSAIHSGANEGRERAKRNPLTNFIRDGVMFVKYSLRNLLQK